MPDEQHDQRADHRADQTRALIGPVPADRVAEPRRDEATDRYDVGEIESRDLNTVVPRREKNVARGDATCFHIAHRECDLRPGVGEGACGLHADARGRSGDDDALARKVNVGEHILGGGVAVEGSCHACHPMECK